MKVKENIERLPEPYRTQALKNYEAAERKAENICTSLMGAFEWEETPEGYEYWNKVHEDIKNSKWNSVENHLPTYNYDVLIYREGGGISMGQYQTEGYWTDIIDGKIYDKGKVTHWQVFPSKP